MSSINITLLVKQAKKGDTDAFGKLYSFYKNEMYCFAYYYLSDAHCAEDAVMEAVLQAFKSVSSVKSPEKFKSWLFTVLLRACQKQLKYVIEMRKTVELDSAYDIPNSTVHTEQSLELKDAISVLDETDRQILLLSAVSGYKSGEIGEMLSMPSGTVRSRLSRATDKLYSILSERSSENDE